MIKPSTAAQSYQKVVKAEETKNYSDGNLSESHKHCVLCSTSNHYLNVSHKLHFDFLKVQRPLSSNLFFKKGLQEILTPPLIHPLWSPTLKTTGFTS